MWQEWRLAFLMRRDFCSDGSCLPEAYPAYVEGSRIAAMGTERVSSGQGVILWKRPVALFAFSFALICRDLTAGVAPGCLLLLDLHLLPCLSRTSVNSPGTQRDTCLITLPVVSRPDPTARLCCPCYCTCFLPCVKQRVLHCV